MVAMEAAEKLDGKVKVLYGVEAYYVDDTARAAYRGEDVTFDDEFAVFDREADTLESLNSRLICFLNVNKIYQISYLILLSLVSLRYSI